MSRATAEKEVRLGELVRVPLAPRLIRQLSVVYPKERFHPRLVTAFVEFAKAGLAAMHTPHPNPLPASREEGAERQRGG